jgi:hypothetical protein
MTQIHPTEPSDRFRFSYGTFARARGNGQDAPRWLSGTELVQKPCGETRAATGAERARGRAYTPWGRRCGASTGPTTSGARCCSRPTSPTADTVAAVTGQIAGRCGAAAVSRPTGSTAWRGATRRRSRSIGCPRGACRATSPVRPRRRRARNCAADAGLQLCPRSRWRRAGSGPGRRSPRRPLLLWLREGAISTLQTQQSAPTTSVGAIRRMMSRRAR